MSTTAWTGVVLVILMLLLHGGLGAAQNALLIGAVAGVFYAIGKNDERHTR